MTNDPAGLAARLEALSPEKQAILARKLAERSAQRGTGERIAPRANGGPAPLSHAQELVWLYEQKSPGTAAYNIAIARRVRGPRDIEALRRALDSVVARHEALRTRFVEIDGAPRQVVLPPEPVPIEQVDLGGLPETSREAEGERLLRDAAARPLDIAAGTHPRVLLVALADDDALLLFVFHHIVFDGISAVVVLRELAAAYAGEELPPVPLQFADFATWEREAAGAARLESALGFWKAELDGAPSGVQLPTDFPRRTAPAGFGGRHVAMLSPETRAAVRQLAAAYDATLYVALMAGFQTLLFRYTGQSDIVVGTGMSGRDRPELLGLVGYLTAALVLRAQFDGDPTFADVLRQARQRAFRALDHQHVPNEELVRQLRAGMPASEQGVFNVVLTLQDASETVPSLGAARFEPYGLNVVEPKFDMFFSVAVVTRGIEVVVDYRSDLFLPETIAGLVRHFEALLVGAARAPDTPVSRLPLMGEEERALVVSAWNDTAAPYPTGRAIHELIAEQAGRTPDALAVIGSDARITYAELEARASGLAAYLAQLGVQQGEMVGVMAERSAETVVNIVAILKAGAAYVPFDPAHPPDRLGFIVEDTRLRFLVGRRPVSTVLGEGSPVTLVSPDARAEPRSAQMHAALGDDIAYVLFTSGSTGRPKGVQVTHENLMVSTWARVLRYQEPVGRYLMLSSFAFDSSVAGLFWPLVQGGAIVVPDDASYLDATALCRLVREERVTHLLAIPSFYYEILGGATPEDLVTLRVAMTGGDYCPHELIERHFALAPQAGFYTEYGPTEITVWCSVMAIEPGEPIPARITIGPPAPNYRMYILDARGEPLPIGVTGEIYIGGPAVSPGYLGRPELNASLFLPDPWSPEPGARMYRGGEQGRWLPNGEIEFRGRMDFRVKVRGYRVELKEVEVTIAKHPSVAQAAAVFHANLGGSIVAYVASTPDAGHPRTPDEATARREMLRTYLAQTLPDYMLPSLIVFLEAMPVTSSGKLERSALPAPDFSAVIAADAAPEGPVEQVVAAVWQQALRTERIGRTTSFFELGGHSLLVTRVVAALARLLRVQLPVRAMFDAPTVAGLASALVARETTPGQTARVAELVLKLQAQQAASSNEISSASGNGPRA